MGDKNLTSFIQEDRKRAEEEKARRIAREKREREAAERRQAQVIFVFDTWMTGLNRTRLSQR